MNLPGATYMVTRTTINSLFLLVPGPVVNAVVEYCLARSAKQYRVQLHAVSFESNHYHMVVTDPHGQLSDFMQEFNRTVARCLKQYYRQRFPSRRLDSVWAPGQSFSASALVNTAAIIEAIVYVLTNPVKDGLVRDYRDWPGFNTRPSQWLNGERVATRPAYYFKRTDSHVTYRVVPPMQLGNDVAAAAAMIEQHVRDELDRLAREAATGKRSFLGAKAVCAVNPFSAPTTPRPVGNRNPQVAAGGDSEAMRVAVQALRAFRLAYREAWALFKRGKDAMFPGGTLLMRKRFNMPCDPLDASCWCQLASASG